MVSIALPLSLCTALTVASGGEKRVCTEPNCGVCYVCFACLCFLLQPALRSVMQSAKQGRVLWSSLDIPIILNINKCSTQINTHRERATGMDRSVRLY